jgi:hypothetical protein
MFHFIAGQFRLLILIGLKRLVFHITLTEYVAGDF